MSGTLMSLFCGESYRLNLLKGFLGLMINREPPHQSCGGCMTQENPESFIGVFLAPEIMSQHVAPPSRLRSTSSRQWASMATPIQENVGCFDEGRIGRLT